MVDVDMCSGNGRIRRRSSDLDVKSMDLAVEYSQAKSNLIPTDIRENQEMEKPSSEDLYRALTDKNRAIEILKRRLTNQQIQLGYYLHKNLATEAVLEFSNKCFPHLAEDNTQLSLAMYKFIRDTGGKTRLAQLREKLTDYNNRVHKALLRQEQLVRQGFGFDQAEELRRNEDTSTEEDDQDQEQNDDLRFAKKYFRSAKLEMCSQLLSITLQVRKELERFRVCAENVVKLEEERNALVDRVFSLPVEQRSDGLRIAMVDNILKLDPSPSIPSMTSVSTNTTADDKPVFNNLGGALQDMESEAIQLLLLSEKQKNEFVIALEEARVENQQLKERLRDLEEAASDERVILLQEKCICIEKEVENMRKDLEAEQNEKERIIKRMASELGNRDSKDKTLKSEVKKLKATVELLRKERDVLQRKLEVTTKQIMINQMHQNTSTDEMMTTKSESVSHQDVDDLTDLVVLQEVQIKDLLSIMSELNLNEMQSNDTFSDDKKSTTSEEASMKGNKKNVDIAETKTRELKATKSLLEVDQQDEYHIYYDSASDFTNNSDDDMAADGSPDLCDSKPSIEDLKSETDFGDAEPKMHRSRSRSVTETRYFDPHAPRHQEERERHREGVATTSLRVQAFDKDGRSESMQAVLECSAPVDGLLEMNNSSKLHLRLQCTSPQRKVDYMESRDSGDHRGPVVFMNSNEHRHLSHEAKMYLTKQLNKIKGQLQTSKSNMTVRKEIVQNLNEIYSQLFRFDDDGTSQSTRS